MVKKAFVFFVLIATIFSQLATAQTDEQLEYLGKLNALRVAVPFLMIAPDSRASAMGDVGVASSPDANSQFWNPAKYAFVKKEWGVGFSYTPWLRNLINDMDLTYLTGYYRFDNQQVVSGSLKYFAMGSIIFTDDYGTRIMEHNANEFAFDGAYSRKFSDKIGGSIAFRYIRSDLTGGFSQVGQPVAKAGNSVAADISTYYQTPLVIDDKNAELAIGANISNIGSKISYNDDATKDFIPINLRLGTRLSLNLDEYNAMAFLIDGNKLLVPTPPRYDNPDDPSEITAGYNPDVPIVSGMIQSFYDAPGGFKEELREVNLGIGLEYLYAGQFAVRAGYFDEHSTKGNRKYFTIGAGLKYNVFQIDFAYLVPRAGQANPLANTVRFTLAFDFEPVKPGGRPAAR
jgi:hypothetical protein